MAEINEKTIDNYTCDKAIITQRNYVPAVFRVYFDGASDALGERMRRELAHDREAQTKEKRSIESFLSNAFSEEFIWASEGESNG